MILLLHVIPAQAGIHCRSAGGSLATSREWTPAFAGVTAMEAVA
jgi:hypothetical protein